MGMSFGIELSNSFNSVMVLTKSCRLVLLLMTSSAVFIDENNEKIRHARTKSLRNNGFHTLLFGSLCQNFLISEFVSIYLTNENKS